MVTRRLSMLQPTRPRQPVVRAPDGPITAPGYPANRRPIIFFPPGGQVTPPVPRPLPAPAPLTPPGYVPQPATSPGYVPQPVTSPGFVPPEGTFTAAAQFDEPKDVPGYSKTRNGIPLTPNERAALLNAMRGGSPNGGLRDRTGDTGEPPPATGGGGGGGGGRRRASGGGGGRGGGGGSRAAAPPADPYGTTWPYTDTQRENRWNAGLSDAPGIDPTWRPGQGARGYSLYGRRSFEDVPGGTVPTPPPGDPGTGVSPTPDPTAPPVVVVPPAPIPIPGDPSVIDPGYQVPGVPGYGAAALSVPDPTITARPAMNGTYVPAVASGIAPGSFGAASVATPYIPTINQSPFAAAATVAPGVPSPGVSPAPVATSPLPPNLNQGGLSGNYSEVGSDMFAEQPELLLRDMLNRQYGQGRAETLYNQLEPYAENANALYLAMSGQDAATGSKADFTDWLGKYWGNKQRAGTYTNVAQGIRNVLAPNASSPLAAYLNDGDPRTQYTNTANLLGALVSDGYHPLFARAMMNRLQDAGLDYQGVAARGGAAVTPFYQWIQQSANIPEFARLMGGQ